MQLEKVEKLILIEWIKLTISSVNGRVWGFYSANLNFLAQFRSHLCQYSRHNFREGYKSYMEWSPFLLEDMNFEINPKKK